MAVCCYVVSVVMLNVTYNSSMLSVVMLSVVAPYKDTEMVSKNITMTLSITTLNTNDTWHSCNQKKTQLAFGKIMLSSAFLLL